MHFILSPPPKKNSVYDPNDKNLFTLKDNNDDDDDKAAMLLNRDW